MRNALPYVPKSQNQMVAAVVRTAFVQPTRQEAVAQWRETADRLRQRFEKLGALMDEAEADVLAFMGFPGPSTLGRSHGRRSRAPIRLSVRTR